MSCVTSPLFSDHSSVASPFNTVISIPKTGFDGRITATVGHGAEIKIYTAVCPPTFSHCASFDIVCALHPGNMLTDKNWNTVYSFEHI